MIEREMQIILSGYNTLNYLSIVYFSIIIYKYLNKGYVQVIIATPKEIFLGKSRSVVPMWF